MRHKRWIAQAAACMMAVSLLAGCERSPKPDALPDTQKAAEDGEKTKLIFWHYYNDVQQDRLNQLIKEYNETRGKAGNVEIEAYSQGSIDDLTKKINLIFDGASNEVEKANMFLAYRDMVADVVKEYPEKLADPWEYLPETALEGYNQDYLEEGVINGRLYILPLVKSTELLLMNQTRLDAFLKENPRYTAADMETWSGLEMMAKEYFDWTDAMTPAVEGDGSPFIGMDNLPNYFIAMNRAMGSRIYYYDDSGTARADLDEENVKELFLNYYQPFTKGYYGAKGKYRSDDVKQSVLAGYIGSSSSVLYFPELVANEEGEMVPIELGVYPYPGYKDYRKTAIQQGAGVAVLNQSREENQACMDFIHWLTADKGLDLAASMSYMPVEKQALTEEEEASIQNPRVIKGLKTGIRQSEEYHMVYGFDFKNSYNVRVELGDIFSLALRNGRRDFLYWLEQGKTMEEASALMDYDAKAEQFYQEIEAVFNREL